MPVTEARTYCRRCRAKLAEPTENMRSSFCCRGCYRMFFAARCLVCEGTMKRNAGNQVVCSRPVCRTEFQSLKRHGVLGSFAGPKTAQVGRGSAQHRSASGITENTEGRERVESDRPCRIAAGSALTPVQLRLITVGAAFGNCPFEQDRKLNRRHWLDTERNEIEAGGYFEDTEWRAAASSDAVGCFVASREVANG
ncbi:MULTISPECIES: hypothetical protein [unclassified Bradyrhizobium]